MMFNTKTALLTATLLAGVATSAQAQIALPAPGPNDADASLHGTGASSISNVLVREFNCIGANNPLGNSSASSAGATGSLPTRTPGNYVAAKPFNCATTDIQPAFSGKYVSTGSGFGRRAWFHYKDNFDGSPSGGVTGTFNPFNTVAGQNRWSHVQFAFSDSPTTPGELTGYQSGGTDSTTGAYSGAFASAGRAIQIPLYILPVAIAYNPIYGKNASGTDMVFNAQYTGAINGVTSKALRLTRSAYCKIFNGEITNWNNPLLQTLNNNKTLQDTVNDSPTRWTNEGVPIRLVGRMDNSGTTDVFTRHLAAVCDAQVTTNKYDINADNLPYNGSTGIDYRPRRADTNYFPTRPASSFSGPINSLSGDYWNDTTKTIAYIGAGPSSTPVNNQGTGLYIVANGGGQLANALNAAPDLAAGSGVTLNGKVGYISADFVPPSVDNAALSYAILQVGTGATYAPPSIANAVKAFGKGATALLPPQSSATGAFLSTDSRTTLNAAGATVTATRDNPLAWTTVLYSAAGGNTLAAPLDGYPIVGTTQFLGYTCYTPTNRSNIVEFLGLTLGKITKNSTGGLIDGKLFNNTSATTPGILVQSNIGTLPSAWVTAISETFLKKSTQASNGVVLGNLNLWIQNKYALTTKSPGDLLSNPNCAGLPGA